MMIVHSMTDEEIPETERRSLLFAGDLFVFAPRSSSRAVATATQDVLEEILGPNAVWAQQRLTEGEFTRKFMSVAQRLSRVLPEVASALVTDFGCDADTTYVGTPSIAATTGMGFLAHGLGVRQHPHRDTWYAASRCQVNWWMPLYDLDASASFAFHPLYWNTPVNNTSSEFDYATWSVDAHDGQAAIDPDPLEQPRALEPISLTPEIRVSCPAGSVILSSAAHLYSAAPNEALKTNFSLHFTSVNKEDLVSGDGPVNLDADPRGTSLLTFVRCSDLTPLPRELAEHELRRRDRGSPLHS
jgi:hypothetical protein